MESKNYKPNKRFINWVCLKSSKILNCQNCLLKTILIIVLLIYAIIHVWENSIEWIVSFTSAKSVTSASTEAIETKLPWSSRYFNQPVSNQSVEFLETTAAVTVQTCHNLTNEQLNRLSKLLKCNNRDFYPQIIPHGDFYVLANFIRATHGSIKCYETVTLVTHATYETLRSLPNLAARWNAPISIAIYAQGDDLGPALDSIRYLRLCINSVVKRWVTFHIIFSYKFFSSIRIPDPDRFLSNGYECPDEPPYNVNPAKTFLKSHNQLYPVNVARNIAREMALTHFILQADMQCSPSPLLVEKFLKAVSKHAKLARKDNIFSLPLFRVAMNTKLPSSKNDLRQMLIQKTALPYKTYNCDEGLLTVAFSECQIMWLKIWAMKMETEEITTLFSSKFDGEKILQNLVFISSRHVPYYDERLCAEGKNEKLTQSYIMCLLGFNFVVLNNLFMTYKMAQPLFKLKNESPYGPNMPKGQIIAIKNIILSEVNKMYQIYDNNCSINYDVVPID